MESGNKAKIVTIGKVILVVGPTAVGKTEICIKLAKEFNCDICSCDSRQFYKEMSIGTAKPTLHEMDGVEHHFINSHSIDNPYSAGDYERELEAFLDEYFKSNSVIILTGGSGLFVQAFTHGLHDMPATPPTVRDNLMNRLHEEGLPVLVNELEKHDIVTFNSLDKSNVQRVVRALEVFYATGKPLSYYTQSKLKEQKFNIIKIGIERPREELYERINTRVDLMLEQGLVQEVESLMQYKEQNALKTVGYKEVFSFLENALSYPSMVDLIKRNTRRYAKRQLTWFKNQDSFNWFSANDLNSIKEFVKKELLTQ